MVAAQTQNEPQEFLDSSLWFLPGIATGVITNDRQILFAGTRLSFDDGRPLHALQVGGLLSLDNKRAVNVIDHPNHSNPTWQLEIRAVSTAQLLKTVGNVYPYSVGFDFSGRLYYIENEYLLRDTDNWSFKLPTGYVRAFDFDKEFTELRVLYTSNSVVRLLIVDLATKTTKSDRALNASVPASDELSHLTQNRIIMVSKSGQITSYRVSDLGLDSTAQLDSSIVYSESKKFPLHEQWLIIRDMGQKVHVVDIATGLRVSPLWLSDLENLSVSTDGKTAVCARTATSPTDGQTHIEVRDIDSGLVISSIPALSPFYFYGVADKTEKVIFSHAQLDLNSGKILRSRGDLQTDPNAIKPDRLISPDGKYILGSRVPRNGTPYWLLDATTLEPIAAFPEQLTYPTMWSGDSKRVVSVVDKTVTYWDIESMSLVSSKTFSASEGLPATRYAFLQDSNEFAYFTFGSDTMFFYDIETWKVKGSFKLPQDAYPEKFWGMVPSENGRFLAIAVYDGSVAGTSIRLYDSITLTKYAVVTYDDRSTPLVVTNDGRYCLLYTDTGYSGFTNIYDAKRHVEERVDESTPIALRRLSLYDTPLANGGELLICTPNNFGGLCALRMPSSFGGVVSVPGRAHRCSEMLATVKVYSAGNTLIINRETRLGQSGRFSAGKPLEDGTYDVWIKPKGCLATRVNGCTIPMKTNEWTPFSCIPGDVNGDNKVTAADVEALSNAFDTFEGDEGYPRDAQLTGDHYVGTDDYLLVSQNQGKIGAN